MKKHKKLKKNYLTYYVNYIIIETQKGGNKMKKEIKKKGGKKHGFRYNLRYHMCSIRSTELHRQRQIMNHIRLRG